MSTFKSPEQVVKAVEQASRRYHRRMSRYDWYVPSERPYKPEIPLRKRTGSFKAANLEFDPIAMQATSYQWWYFVKRINGLVVFNDYGYSPTTRRHQSRVRQVMADLRIRIDLEVEAPKGLQRLDLAVELDEERIRSLVAAIQNPRARKDKNRERAATVRALQARVKAVRKLIAKQASS